MIASQTALKGICNISVIQSNFYSLFSFFSDNESPEKPTLEWFGVEGIQPVHSLDKIVSKIEEIEGLCSNSSSRNSSSNNNLEGLRTRKKCLMQTLTSHEVATCLPVCVRVSNT